jgi:hypothetical protein
MAIQIFRNAYISLNAVVLSDHGVDVTLDTGREMQDKTAFGADTRINIAGLKTWTLTITFQQDYAAAKVDPTLWPLYDGGTEFAIELRADAGAVSSTNPKWTGNGVISSYTPVGGAIGDLQMAPVTIEAAGTLTRATA